MAKAESLAGKATNSLNKVFLLLGEAATGERSQRLWPKLTAIPQTTSNTAVDTAPPNIGLGTICSSPQKADPPISADEKKAR